MTNDDIALCHAFASAAGIDRERVLSVERQPMTEISCSPDTGWRDGPTVDSVHFKLNGAMTREELVGAAKSMMTTLFTSADSRLYVWWDEGPPQPPGSCHSQHRRCIAASRADIERLP